MKSGRPDFGVFESCPVVKSSGFQTTSESRTVWEPEAFRKRRNPDVLFSDVYCTVTVRNPDVRISALSKTLRFVICPAFRHCLLTGQYCPVIGRPVPINLYVRLSDVRFQLLLTGQPVPKPVMVLILRFLVPKPVWNRFMSEIRT